MEVTLDQLEVSKYPAYKDSGVEWLGEIPEHWAVERLASFGKFSKGGGFSKSDLTSEGIAAVLYGDIYTKYDISISEAVRFISHETASKSISIKKNNLLFTGSGETIEDIGKCVVFLSDKKTVAGGDVIIFEISRNNSLFLSYALNTDGVKQEKAKHSKGEIIVHTYGSKLRNIYLPIPPLPEQTAIANFLDKKTSLIDQAIQIKEKQITLLKERRQILIHQAVTRGLDPNVKLKDSEVEWIGMIPEQWEVKKITHIFSKIGSGTTPTSGDLRYYGGKTNFLQTGDLNDGYIIETNKTLKDKALKDFSSLKIYPKGSLVMAMYGATIGKLGILQIEAATNQACCVLGDSKEVSPEYMFFLLLAFRKQIISFGYGGGQPNISQDLIKSLRFPIPESMQEQLQILNKIKAFTDKIDQTIFLKEKEIEKLKEYKATLINSAVTGKIKV